MYFLLQSQKAFVDELTQTGSDEDLETIQTYYILKIENKS